MKFNQIKSIDNAKGPYLIVVDYGTEGLHVMAQHESAQDAVDEILSGRWSGPMALLYLPTIHAQPYIPLEVES